MSGGGKQKRENVNGEEWARVPGISARYSPDMEECLVDTWQGTDTLLDILQGLQELPLPLLVGFPDFLDLLIIKNKTITKIITHSPKVKIHRGSINNQ